MPPIIFKGINISYKNWRQSRKMILIGFEKNICWTSSWVLNLLESIFNSSIGCWVFTVLSLGCFCKVSHVNSTTFSGHLLFITIKMHARLKIWKSWLLVQMVSSKYRGSNFNKQKINILEMEVVILLKSQAFLELTTIE